MRRFRLNGYTVKQSCGWARLTELEDTCMTAERELEDLRNRKWNTIDSIFRQTNLLGCRTT